MTTTKKQSKPTDSFIAYSRYVQEELGRNLTQKEVQYCMQCYIKPINVDECVEKLKRGIKQ